MDSSYVAVVTTSFGVECLPAFIDSASYLEVNEGDIVHIMYEPARSVAPTQTWVCAMKRETGETGWVPSAFLAVIQRGSTPFFKLSYEEQLRFEQRNLSRFLDNAIHYLITRQRYRIEGIFRGSADASEIARVKAITSRVGCIDFEKVSSMTPSLAADLIKSYLKDIGESIIPASLLKIACQFQQKYGAFYLPDYHYDEANSPSTTSVPLYGPPHVSGHGPADPLIVPRCSRLEQPLALGKVIMNSSMYSLTDDSIEINSSSQGLESLSAECLLPSEMTPSEHSRCQEPSEKVKTESDMGRGEDEMLFEIADSSLVTHNPSLTSLRISRRDAIALLGDFLFRTLPMSRFILLRHLMNLCSEIVQASEVTKMDSHALARIIYNYVLNDNDDDTQAAVGMRFTEILLYNWLDVEKYYLQHQMPLFDPDLPLDQCRYYDSIGLQIRVILDFDPAKYIGISNSPLCMRVKAGDVVTILAESGEWVLVGTAERQGWVDRLCLLQDGAFSPV
ncbi:putative Rho GAP [Giardia muris]|uniref:Putative Rho GAP n=1 Tax=Giardia muris TaxID=5742 RepID=A0A4Z1TBI8_GIAMU|nr:putative Rho GAP [Giardia muris]|eukprot:TNJ29891.1 putative Rho GAP [Giardia muris]